MAFVLVESLAHNKGKFAQIAIKALEILFLSAGFISILLMFKEAQVPTFPCQILVEFWKLCNSFLSSSLCMIAAINSVILLIVISSRFHHHQHLVDEHDHNDVDVEDSDIKVSKSPTIIPSELPTIIPTVTESPTVIPSELPTIIPTVTESPTVIPSQHNKKTESTTENDEKNSEEEYEDVSTMDATWQAITRGGKDKQKPKREQVMKKSETWDAVRRRRAAGVQRVDSEELFASRTSYCAWKELRKSETFNDAVSIVRRGGLRRDSLTSLDELNSKVEAFIKRFNDNMRLQRQESYQRFLDMINNRHL